MPEAIATTKRKFYKALDALTTATSQIASQQPESGVHKRPVSAAVAFEEARERVRKRLRHTTSTASLVSSSQISPSAPLTQRTTSSSSGSRILVPALAPTKENSAPKFAPWSHDAFLTRLKTFSSVSRWHPKPEQIGEVQWAKRGWICVDVNTVSCRGGCERRVVVSLEASSKTANTTDENGEESRDSDDDEGNDVASALEEALVERYKATIINGHADNCLWHKAGCKDDIYRLQVVRPAVWQPALRSRFNSLLDIGDGIIRVNIKEIDSNTESAISIERLLSALPTDVLGTFDAPPATAEIALRIALHGWRGASEAGNQLLHCDACFQRIGLWMYQPDYRPSTRGRDAHSDESHEGESRAGAIDLLEMHRDHCPWRNPGSQHAIGSLSGLNACQILRRVATTCARDHRRRTGDQHDLGAAHSEQEEEAAEIHNIGETPTFSREDIAAQDRERESRLRKLKNLFSMKRRSTIKPMKKVT